MKQRLETPLLLQTDEDCEFMIAEQVEIFCSCDNQQITYYGTVYNYELGTAECVSEQGEWVYDATLNIRLDEKS